MNARILLATLERRIPILFLVSFFLERTINACGYEKFKKSLLILRLRVAEELLASTEKYFFSQKIQIILFSYYCWCHENCACQLSLRTSVIYSFVRLHFHYSVDPQLVLEDAFRLVISDFNGWDERRQY